MYSLRASVLIMPLLLGCMAGRLDMVSQPKPAIDALADVTVGMRYPDVYAALKAHGFGDYQVTRMRCLNEVLELKRRRVNLSDQKGSCISTLRAKSARSTLFISFVEDLPREPKTSVAVIISANPIRTPSADLSLRHIEAVLGSPSAVDRSANPTIALWCFGFRCAKTDINFSSPALGMLVSLNAGVGISLTDNRYATARRTWMDRQLERHGIEMTY